jgi:hypothetical protein
MHPPLRHASLAIVTGQGTAAAAAGVVIVSTAAAATKALDRRAPSDPPRLHPSAIVPRPDGPRAAIGKQTRGQRSAFQITCPHFC